MGKHTAYWQQYGKAQIRDTLRIFAAIAAWLLVVVGVALAEDTLGDAFPWAIGGAFVGLAATIVWMTRHVYRVVCPECGTTYQRHRYGGQCTRCGLKLLQADP
jgi:hypothetical protein